MFPVEELEQWFLFLQVRDTCICSLVMSQPRPSPRPCPSLHVHVCTICIHACTLVHTCLHNLCYLVLYTCLTCCSVYTLYMCMYQILQECATFFLESSREKIKHAIAALLVEILYPVAAVINVEASLPVIKRFVSMLYTHCFEQARKGRHSTQKVSGLLYIWKVSFVNVVPMRIFQHENLLYIYESFIT